MTEKKISGTAQISDDGIKKHFMKYEPWEALFELVWNGLDAKAKTLKVLVDENELGGVDAVSVLDDGEGINVENIGDNFGRFNDSQKKSDVTQHGSHGRGRLAFHRLATNASWWTKVAGKDAIIEIYAGSISKYVGEYIDSAFQHPLLTDLPTGTLAELRFVHTNLPTIPVLLDKFSIEFGWYLALHKNRKITINEIDVEVPAHDISEKKINLGENDFNIKVIRWHLKPTSEKSYIYLLDSEGDIRYKQLSSFNQKANFFASIYVQSEWADTFSSEGKTLFSPNAHSVHSEEWRRLDAPLHDFVEMIYAEFLRLYIDEEIRHLDETGAFPTYSEFPAPYATWRAANTRNIVKMVYMSDPTLMNSLNKKQKKVVIRLLDRLSVSNENDAIFDIINEVLDLDEKSLKTLAQQLKHTQLVHIISTIELLQQRQLAVDKLRQLMDEHYRDVLETPDLQQIIESNTWLFGNQYETIGAEEDSFVGVARNLREALTGISIIDIDDVEDESDIPGVKRQTDLFLARKIPTIDSLGKAIYRCIVIEIKRPGIALNQKHLRQLDEYAAIIKKHPAFASEHLHFELLLIGRKISEADFEIKSRLQNQISKGELGLVSSDPGMKRYVLNWYTLLDGFELAHTHLLKTLELRREALAITTTKELVDELQSSH